ncbi:5460_t:CDS:2 [Paraglomus brasilianum]|uniref:5460_t:CDS:1 n=1 Tax=Paraglomus brasilianum TaxID=144538 RepID=A0A9N8YVH0_9GLOM|nr:5460_t:CDS:2 [Paraglomus brasilianum]
MTVFLGNLAPDTPGLWVNCVSRYKVTIALADYPGLQPVVSSFKNDPADSSLSQYGGMILCFGDLIGVEGLDERLRGQRHTREILLDREALRNNNVVVVASEDAVLAKRNEHLVLSCKKPFDQQFLRSGLLETLIERLLVGFGLYEDRIGQLANGSCPATECGYVNDEHLSVLIAESSLERGALPALADQIINNLYVHQGLGYIVLQEDVHGFIKDFNINWVLVNNDSENLLKSKNIQACLKNTARNGVKLPPPVKVPKLTKTLREVNLAIRSEWCMCYLSDDMRISRVGLGHDTLMSLCQIQKQT